IRGRAAAHARERAGLAGDVHDAPPAALAHAAAERLRQPPRAEQVGGERFLDDSKIGVERILECVVVDGGVVDENVDSAELAIDREGGVAGVAGGHVEPANHEPRFAQRGRGALALFELATGEHDPQATLEQLPAHFEPQPTVRSGHQCEARHAEILYTARWSATCIPRSTRNRMNTVVDLFQRRVSLDPLAEAFRLPPKHRW